MSTFHKNTLSNWFIKLNHPGWCDVGRWRRAREAHRGTRGLLGLLDPWELWPLQISGLKTGIGDVEELVFTFSKINRCWYTVNVLEFIFSPFHIVISVLRAIIRNKFETQMIPSLLSKHIVLYASRGVLCNQTTLLTIILVFIDDLVLMVLYMPNSDYAVLWFCCFMYNSVEL
jgi:hypothetical protein